MPAAAVGVLAARRAAGLLDSTTIVARKDGVAPLLFTIGAWTLLVGVIAHELHLLKLHYILMPAGTVVIATAVVVVHSSSGARLQNNAAHGHVGYAALSLLVLQWLTGSYIRTVKWSTRQYWRHHVLHRVPGMVAIVLIAYLYLSAAYIDHTALLSYYSTIAAFEVTAGLYVGLTAVSLAPAIFVLRTPHTLHPTRALPPPPTTEPLLERQPTIFAAADDITMTFIDLVT